MLALALQRDLQHRDAFEAADLLVGLPDFFVDLARRELGSGGGYDGCRQLAATAGQRGLVALRSDRGLGVHDPGWLSAFKVQLILHDDIRAGSTHQHDTALQLLGIARVGVAQVNNRHPALGRADKADDLRRRIQRLAALGCVGHGTFLGSGFLFLVVVDRWASELPGILAEGALAIHLELLWVVVVLQHAIGLGAQVDAPAHAPRIQHEGAQVELASHTPVVAALDADKHRLRIVPATAQRGHVLTSESGVCSLRCAVAAHVRTVIEQQACKAHVGGLRADRRCASLQRRHAWIAVEGCEEAGHPVAGEGAAFRVAVVEDAVARSAGQMHPRKPCLGYAFDEGNAEIAACGSAQRHDHCCCDVEHFIARIHTVWPDAARSKAHNAFAKGLHGEVRGLGGEAGLFIGQRNGSEQQGSCGRHFFDIRFTTLDNRAGGFRIGFGSWGLTRFWARGGHGQRVAFQLGHQGIHAEFDDCLLDFRCLFRVH